MQTLRVFLKFDLGQLPRRRRFIGKPACPGPGGARAGPAEGMETNSSVALIGKLSGARSHYDGRNRIFLYVFFQNLAITPPHFASALSVLTSSIRARHLAV